MKASQTITKKFSPRHKKVPPNTKSLKCLMKHVNFTSLTLNAPLSLSISVLSPCPKISTKGRSDDDDDALMKLHRMAQHLFINRTFFNVQKLMFWVTQNAH